MNKKIVSLLLLCLVALSIVYVCSITALSSHATQSIDVMASRATASTEEHHQNTKLSNGEPTPRILGDPIDDPKPRKK